MLKCFCAYNNYFEDLKKVYYIFILLRNAYFEILYFLSALIRLVLNLVIDISLS